MRQARPSTVKTSDPSAQGSMRGSPCPQLTGGHQGPKKPFELAITETIMSAVMPRMYVSGSSTIIVAGGGGGGGAGASPMKCMDTSGTRCVVKRRLAPGTPTKDNAMLPKV